MLVPESVLEPIQSVAPFALVVLPSEKPVILSKAVSVESWSALRSEERRVGKECRSRWRPDHYKKKRVSVANTFTLAVQVLPSWKVTVEGSVSLSVWATVNASNAVELFGL